VLSTLSPYLIVSQQLEQLLNEHKYFPVLLLILFYAYIIHQQIQINTAIDIPVQINIVLFYSP